MSAILHAIHRAMMTSPAVLPNAEIVLNCWDKAVETGALWALTRAEPATNVTWLMPDFGFWSWPEPKTGAFTEIRRKAVAMEESADENPSGIAWSRERKIPKLLWRGALIGGLRQGLVDKTKGQDWADVELITWADKEGIARKRKDTDEHCQYKFLAYTEGTTYSGRMKYLQMCRSVMISHKLHWPVHTSHLLVKEGPDQNYVEVEDDFSDLAETIDMLLIDDAKAKRIADNQVRLFRDRYLTPAANVCYWRRLISGWREASFEPKFFKTENGKKVWRGLPVESYLLLNKLDWEPY